jgi:hypothetical protein
VCALAAALRRGAAGPPAAACVPPLGHSAPRAPPAARATPSLPPGGAHVPLGAGRPPPPQLHRTAPHQPPPHQPAPNRSECTHRSASSPDASAGSPVNASGACAAAPRVDRSEEPRSRGTQCSGHSAGTWYVHVHRGINRPRAAGAAVRSARRPGPLCHINLRGPRWFARSRATWPSLACHSGTTRPHSWAYKESDQG